MFPMDFMSTEGPSSSSLPSSSSTPSWKYDVFLSFRGEDTCYNFTDHLYAALKQKGIFTFRDDEKSQEILKVIEESRCAVVILSGNYASSTWCLAELAEIVRCRKETGLVILPVFYGVNPSDVRHQTGNFQVAFAKHEADKREEVDSWRAALTELANLSGWHLEERKYESEAIQRIVEELLRRLSSKFSSITKDLVGIDSPMEELITPYLDLGNRVCMIGICGMGGLGKTTLARVIYEMKRNHFEGSSFISNIREVSEKHDLVRLQKQLLAQILEEENINIWDVDDGVNKIKNRLCHKKVLLVLDDVNQLNQLEKLAGEHCWFGLGSWIIITTRDEHLLVQHGVRNRYKPNTLNCHDALRLFCLKAFKNVQPKAEYLQLSQDVVYYANGLPLALVTLGSFLFEREKDEWQSALNNLKKNPKREIFDTLKVSYDGLEEMWKAIFLDIACFFRGKMKDRVIEMLENCGFDAKIGIRVLMDKSLITVEEEKLCMHDLLQEMGWEIVRLESREPGKRSRLWLRKDLSHVLMNNTATEAIQAIVLDVFGGDEASRNPKACRKAFSKMCNLRLLIIDNVDILNGLNHLSNDLRYLEWRGYSSKCLPSSFQSRELVELKLWFSEIEYLWRGVKYLDKLKLIDLEFSKNLITTPDFTGVPRVERLCLRGCINLVEIHPSIGQLSWLTYFNLEFCLSLINLPSNMDGLRSLEVLILLGCSKLANLPENLGKIKCLKELDLSGTAISEVPSSISFLICRGCEKQFFKSRLDSVVCFRSLKYLSLSANNLVFTLPASISQLLKLEVLNLGNCIRLHSLPELPSNVRNINAEGCSSLEPSPALLSMSNLSQPSISFFNCFKCFEYNESSDGLAFAILKRYLQKLIYPKTGYETSPKRKNRSGAAFQIIIPGFEIPQWLTHQRFWSSISIELPPNWCNSRWMGFALCAFFRINCCGYSSERYSLKGRVIALGDMPHYTVEVFIGETSFECIVGHLWLLYLSRDDWLATRWNDQCSRIKVAFDTNSPSVEVIKCGVRLIYEQDVEEFNQSIAQKATKIKGTCDDYNDAEPSASWSSPKETERCFSLLSAIGKTKYEEMALVFGKDMATWNSAESYSDIDSDKRIVDLDSNDLDIDFEKASKGKQVSSSNAALSQARSHRKRNHANVIEDAVYDRLGKADQLAIKKLKKDQLDVNKLYEDVMKIEKFDEVMLASAFDYLVEVGNERVAKAFMAKNTRLRTVWLESFFNKNGGYRT